MRGSTRKRGTTWTAYYDGPPDPHTGKRQQRSKGGFKRQKDAQAFLNRTLPAVEDGTYVEPSRQPLAHFLLDEWWPGIRQTVRPLTSESYERIARTYIAGRDIGAIPLRGLTGAHLNKLYGDLERDGLSPASIRLTHAVLRRALNDAVRWGKLSRNPAAAADPPALPRSRAQAWTTSELRRFLAHVADDRLFALWRLGATTGMRRGELLGLTWRAVDVEGAQLRVDQQLVATKSGCTFGPPKSRRSERTIALDPETVDALRHHREVQILERDLAGPAYEDKDLVFCDQLGRPVRPLTATEWFTQKRKACGLTGTLHTLRHTAATIALTGGIPLHVVAARLGDRPETILGTYAHLLPHSDAEAAAVVAAAIVDKPLTDRAPRAADAPQL